MYQLQTFQYNNNTENPVAIATDNNGNILFDASHVCAILGYTKPAANIVEKLDDDEKVLIKTSDLTETVKSGNNLSPGAVYKWHVYESGLYKLILRSNKAEAKAFTRFVTHELLPTIRKTGAYTMPDAKPDMAAIEKTLSAAKRASKEMGMNEAQARLKAAEAVKRYHQVDIYELLGMEEPKEEENRQNPTPDKPDSFANKILAYVKRKGLKQIKTRDLCRAGVPGCRYAKETKENMQELVDSGQAMWVANALLQMVNWQNS